MNQQSIQKREKFEFENFRSKRQFLQCYKLFFSKIPEEPTFEEFNPAAAQKIRYTKKMPMANLGPFGQTFKGILLY